MDTLIRELEEEIILSLIAHWHEQDEKEGKVIINRFS
jgi:hypothetical protein